MAPDSTTTPTESWTDAAIVLSDRERDRLGGDSERTARRMAHASLDDQDLLVEAELLGCQLPERLLRGLSRFRTEGSRFGGLLIRNLPVDQALPDTPGTGYLPSWSAVPVATFVQLAVASRLGDILSYADEKDGRLVQDVIPLKGAEQRQENSGTALLELHTEDGFHPYKPDFVTLFCLRPDHERAAHTLLGAVARVLPLLPDTCVETLREPLFRMRASSSFGDDGQSVVTPPIAVLSGVKDDPEFVADFHTMEPLDARARAALERLAEVLVPSLTPVALDAGDLLVVDNRMAVHGRTGFRARFDGTDRWLRRCFAVADLRRSRGVRAAASRVCAPLPMIAPPARATRPLRP